MPKVRITGIKCLHSSSGTNDYRVNILGVDLRSSMKNVVDASDSCLLAMRNGVLAVESQVTFTRDSDMGEFLDGPDRVYFKCWADDVERVHWTGGYEDGVDMSNGTEVKVDSATFTFAQKGDIRVYEYDSLSADDDMGGLTWHAAPDMVYGPQAVIVQTRKDSSCYQISYSLDG